MITVTSRGRRIAQIVPSDGHTLLERGLREGWITRGEDRPPEPVTRHRPVVGSPTIPWIVPPRLLVSAIDQTVSSIDARIEIAVRESDGLVAIRDTLLPKLVSGEVRLSRGRTDTALTVSVCWICLTVSM